MEKNSYQAAKRYIFDKLNNVPAPLDKSAIQQEIYNLKAVIGAVPESILLNILSVNDFISPEENEWEQMKYEFEVHFDVGMRHGIVIQGNEQQLRDTTWWTSTAKGQNKLYYWDRYREYLSKSLPPSVVKTTDDDTDEVMNNLEPASTERFSRYGMVVGHVQSGKTLNYSSLICKAADEGYKFIVVIAGGINNLRDQTQERMNESFVGYSGGDQVGAGIGAGGKQLMPLSLTTILRDFNKQDADRLAQGINFETVNVPVLLVIKKNTSTLKNVIEWLEKQYRGNDIEHAMLVIDDESDYASINTKGEEDPTVINKSLRQLLSLFKRSAYVAYTATPYANIFIDHKASNDEVGKDLFPKDFIYSLNAPTNYFGARKIFIDSQQRHLVAIDDHETLIPYNHKKDFTLDKLPSNLLDAVRLFVINIAIRRLRGQGDKHNSMLIHATRFTDVHKNLALLTGEYLDFLKKDVLAYALLPNAENYSDHLAELSRTYYRYHTETDKSWDDVLRELESFVSEVIIRDVHAKSSIPLEYKKDVVTNAIVVGGASLARGFTVEGLSVSYFLRNTVFYDTLMQMGRWFGYRPGYEDLCRIFMPQDRINDFAEIIRATEDLVGDFKLMAYAKKTPEDFGLYITENPDSALQVTARNKQKNMTYYYHDMRLEGSLKETSYLRKEQTVIDENIQTVRDLLDELPVQEMGKEIQSILWTNIERSLIKKFVNKYKTYDKDKLGLSSRMPIGFIKEYIDKTDTLWDVALYNGEGDLFEHNGYGINRQKRRFSNKKDCYEVLHRQVSSGSAEAIAIVDTEVRRSVSNDRKSSRGARTKPLLMLHILQDQNSDGTQNFQEIAAYGISFHGNVLSPGKPIRLMINTVYLDQLVESMNKEEE